MARLQYTRLKGPMLGLSGAPWHCYLQCLFRLGEQLQLWKQKWTNSNKVQAFGDKVLVRFLLQTLWLDLFLLLRQLCSMLNFFWSHSVHKLTEPLGKKSTSKVAQKSSLNHCPQRNISTLHICLPLWVFVTPHWYWYWKKMSWGL